MIENGLLGLRTHLRHSPPRRETINNALRTPILSEKELTAAIESICGKYGEIAYLQIFPGQALPHKQCVCLIRMQSAVAEDNLTTHYKFSRIGAELAFVINVDDNYVGEEFKCWT